MRSTQFVGRLGARWCSISDAVFESHVRITTIVHQADARDSSASIPPRAESDSHQNRCWVRSSDGWTLMTDAKISVVSSAPTGGQNQRVSDVGGCSMPNAKLVRVGFVGFAIPSTPESESANARRVTSPGTRKDWKTSRPFVITKRARRDRFLAKTVDAGRRVGRQHP